jgi:ATP-dependent helicase HepA
MNGFIKGQRWMSESEPELGLATVVEAGHGRVRIVFSATGETRTYAADNAPLKRVRFRAGDLAETQTGKRFRIKKVTEVSGLLTYAGDEGAISEVELKHTLSLHGPEERLFAGRFDESATFDLRRRTLSLFHRIRKSPVRGFLGGRIDLIPHQLYIAHEVANRQAPRVMLSDETGLGKTIEACLISHRLLLSGRAARVLVLVPESLVHQWFVEMLRRFNVRLSIFDEERCLAIESGEPGANPFLDDQLILTSLDFLSQSTSRSAQAAEAGWDVLVVDEAHHLEWSEENPSREYQVVEALSRRSEGLLLLTATPEQLGIESHFARLRLLDPDRYRDLVSFQAESKDYRTTAQIVEKLMADRELDSAANASLKELLAHDASTKSRLERLRQEGGDARRALLDDLLDLHGPGRVLFRNTRSAMSGFPRRRPHLYRLALDGSAEAQDSQMRTDPEHWLDRLSTEFAADAGDTSLEAALDLGQDPRILWLLALLQRLEPAKVLLICRTLEKVEAIDEALRRHTSIKTGIFHEGLTLLQRDRNAAWFAETGGARLLLCSEIGSEGRNFQFAHHLVLFDLPLNPELLEQRIGRLDRIGQKDDIRIHVPFLARSPQEVLARWYSDGLDAFQSNLEGGYELLRQFGRTVHDVALEFPVAEPDAARRELDDLLSASKAARVELRRVLEQGRDRLLEMNSFRPAVAQQIISQIHETEKGNELENYLLDLFEHFGVHAEELAPHTWQLNPQGVITDSFPSIPPEGLVATCDRRRALAREDVAFLTWDHPIVTGGMELLLGSERGNCAFGVLPSPKERTMLLELVFVLEAIAEPRLHADRFLPATPIRLVINHKTENITDSHPPEAFEGTLQKGSPYKLSEHPEIAQRTLPSMFTKGSQLAETEAGAVRESALKEMQRLLGHEVQRLETLMRVNDHIRPREIELARAQQEALAAAIVESRIRLDSARLIWKGPPEALRASNPS